MSKAIINRKSVLIGLSYFVFLFQQAMIASVNGILKTIISYSDEVFVVALFGYTLFFNRHIIRLKNQRDKIGIVCLLFFLLFGITSAFFHRFQSIPVAFVDAFVCSKFYIVYFCMINILENKTDVEKLHRTIYVVSLISIIAIFMLTVINLFLPIFPRADFRYFTYGIKLFFGHPTFFAAACMTCVVSMISYNAYRKKKTIDIFIMMGLFSCAMSLRTKAVVAAIAVIFMYVYFTKMKSSNIYLACFAAAVLILLLGYDQLAFYYGGHSLTDDNFVRERLMYDSIRIAKRFFPLGSGFATFGSDMANKFFSPLYGEYGYYTTRFLSDTFWPIIIAQTGFLGLLAFLGVFTSIVVNIFYSRKVDKYIFISSVAVIIYVLICSTGESAFFHPTVMPMFMIVGINEAYVRSRDESKKDSINRRALFG